MLIVIFYKPKYVRPTFMILAASRSVFWEMPKECPSIKDVCAEASIEKALRSLWHYFWLRCGQKSLQVLSRFRELSKENEIAIKGVQRALQ